MRFKKYLLILLALTLIAAVCGCKEQNAYAPPPPATVTVALPVVKDTTHYLYKTGRFSANQDITVTARVAGVLEQRLFEEGHPVNAGDTLFIIEQTQYKAAVDEAQAALLSAQASLKSAKATLDRKSAAFKQRAVSEIEVILAQADYDQAQAAVKNAQAALTNAELNYSYTEVKAPVSGRISRSLVDVGNLVGPNGNAVLTTIMDVKSLKVYFSVTENELAVYLREDAPRPEERNGADASRFIINAGIGQANDFPYNGTIDFVDNAVDTNTGTILLRGTFDNPDGKLVAGMFTRIRLPLRMVENALTIPEIALGQSQAGYFVYTVDDQNVAHMANVQVRFIQEGVAVIDSGITAQDKVVVNGMSLIQDGRPVNPTEAGSQPQMPATGSETAQ